MSVLATTAVIASPAGSGHADVSHAGGTSWVIVLAGVIAAGGFAAFLVSQPHWLSRTGHPQPVSPPVMLSILAWHWLVTPALAGGLLMWMAPQAAKEPLAFQDLALRAIVVESVAALAVLVWWLMRRIPAEQEWAMHALRRLGGASKSGSPHRRASSAPAAVGIGVLGLVVCWPVVLLTSEIAGAIYEALTGQPSPRIAHATLEQLAAADRSDPWLWAMIAMVMSLVPLVEEVVFRGALQGCLRGFVRSPWVAIALASLLFGCVHIGTAAAVAIPGLVVFGLGLGIVYERSGSLLAPMVMHGLFNLGNVLLLLLLQPPV